MSGSDPSSVWTRRNFLTVVGRIGGTAAVYETMVALGLIRIPEAFAAPDLPRSIGRGQSVVILGAGIAGMTAAYELSRAGYSVTLLEAKKRSGGRSLTVRRGDVIEEVGEDGSLSKQQCRFDDGLYMNAGPGRIPHHHTAALHYCRSLGVPLEVYVMSTRANLFQKESAFEGHPVQNRQLDYDMQGYVAELLSKAVHRNALDDQLSAVDREALLDFLAADRLDAGGAYKGSWSAGAEIEPAVTTMGKAKPPIPLVQLLGSRFWQHMVYQPDNYEWQATLFQPVGGMDRLARGFATALPRRSMRLDREVTSIRNVDGGVEVIHRSASTRGDAEKITADWCISTIPLPLLTKIENNFEASFRSSIAALEFAPTCKVGWQANRRFWEEDGQIYGGISYVDHNITQLWYPSNGFFTAKGILTGAYNYQKRAEAMSTASPAERLSLAAEGARRLHPDFDRWVPKELGLSISWKRVPFQCGGWPEWRPEQVAEYERFLRPEGRVWIAGDQVSYLPGWQEGAIRSALHVVKEIAVPQSEVRVALTRAPQSPRLPRVV
jgi:monoamine oxidase